MFLFRVLLFIFFAMNSVVYALKIEIKSGQVKPDPIAIVDFYDDGGDDSQDGSELCDIIKSDLELSGLFVPIDSNVFLETKKDLAMRGPNLKNWGVLNARFLVHGKVVSRFGNITVTFKLIDVVTGDVMLSIEVKGTKSNFRKLAHSIADYIYKRITNEDGYFGTNIVYVETAYNKVSSKRRTRLIKIDQDGQDPRPLTDGSELVVTPRYSGDGNMIAYIAYNDRGNGALGKSAQVYILDLSSGARRLMINESLMKNLIKKNHGNPVQMTYAPRFSPNGEEAVCAIIIDGKSAIYKINFVDNKLIQLTQHEGIDTSPCFSPDGKQIVFTSNRAGKEAIYLMNTDGSDQKKISSGDGKYSQPVWSPRGDLIVFSKQKGGLFFIVVMKTDGSGERSITSGYLVEAPCWSSNGRYIVYSGQSGPGAKNVISIVDLTGLHIRQIETHGDGSYPAWSPSVASP
ncbi:MAG: Tol-Pal system protein TolB [Holosporales bacterium]|jgi:TolB protein|nr:Tol-Pal system protein TolB [Holosporales bacterium]